ncbi:outer membrane beta-barrel protein [Spirosoma sp. HMF3257]|uniref:PorT family protein n=1 Tax=Spirosoma telluris TaxID=2183553 RepID=A0A327NIK3_9BACT|nr:outer membrane beta-barrel protein [Spirosoma telluris]RAI74683.1 PorT family protein [Spirosoma telluris]
MKLTSIFRFVLLLTGAFSVQACENFMPEGSADLVKNRYHGPSYDKTHPAPAGYDVGFNIAMYYLLSLARGGSSTSLHALPPASDNLLASTSRQLTFESSYIPPKPTSFFQSEHFVLMPGLQLIRKGNRFSDSFGTDVTHLLYLELPIYALYRHQLPDNKGELFGGLGPYFGYGLAGNFKFTFNGETTKVPAFDAKNGGFKRFDAGVSLTAGYQFPGSLRVRLAYELGLVNLESGPSGGFGDKTFNRALSLNVGYPLDKIVNKFKKK